MSNYIDAIPSHAADTASEIETQIKAVVDAIMRKYAFRGVPVSTIAMHAHSAVEQARAEVVQDPQFVGIVYDDTTVPPLTALGPHLQGFVMSPQHVPVFKDTQYVARIKPRFPIEAYTVELPQGRMRFETAKGWYSVSLDTALALRGVTVGGEPVFDVVTQAEAVLMDKDPPQQP